MSQTIGNDKPAIPVLEQHAFAYSDGDLTCMGMRRLSEHELRHFIMEPNGDKVTAEARSLWEDNFEKIVTTKFLEAQLQFYGESYYPYPAMRRVLLNMLRQAVEADKCRQVPEKVKKIEAEMRAKYKPRFEKYQSDLRAWELSEAQQQAVQGSPTEMALDEALSNSVNTEMDIESEVSEEPNNQAHADPSESPTNEHPQFPVVERYGFTYTQSRLTFNDMGPMPEDGLRALVAAIDERTSSEEDPKAWDAKVYQVASKELIEAQLRFYAIWFETTPFLRILVNLFRNGVNSGQFRAIPASTRKLEAELKAEYEKKLQGTNVRRA